MKSSKGERTFSSRGPRSGGLHYGNVSRNVGFLGNSRANLVVSVFKEQNLSLVKVLEALFPPHQLQLMLH